ncbi:hypothetical protein T12_7521 [Trichinella patagoniensis]|uniref:Secreted protein n=1 Tax=Trichinella patagoniensis TaxID=990121 RepID=A0A0V1A939_9BILA|nr:hypothetical protein T12_7521 [Trichinella patagoniensis]
MCIVVRRYITAEFLLLFSLVLLQICCSSIHHSPQQQRSCISTTASLAMRERVREFKNCLADNKQNVYMMLWNNEC